MSNTPTRANAQLTSVLVTELPLCDLCLIQQALVDGRLAHRTSWAYMCQRCFSLYGAGLGTGIGQMLYTSATELAEARKQNNDISF